MREPRELAHTGAGFTEPLAGAGVVLILLGALMAWAGYRDRKRSRKVLARFDGSWTQVYDQDAEG